MIQNGTVWYGLIQNTEDGHATDEEDECEGAVERKRSKPFDLNITVGEAAFIHGLLEIIRKDKNMVDVYEKMMDVKDDVKRLTPRGKFTLTINGKLDGKW